MGRPLLTKVTLSENKKSKSGPAEAGEKTHPAASTPSPCQEKKTVDSCFNLRLKPKLKPDPLSVWLVDVAMFSAGAHGKGEGGPVNPYLCLSVCLLRSYELIKTRLNHVCPSL